MAFSLNQHQHLNLLSTLPLPFPVNLFYEDVRIAEKIALAHPLAHFDEESVPHQNKFEEIARLAAASTAQRYLN
jgi:hypothetical protein